MFFNYVGRFTEGFLYKMIIRLLLSLFNNVAGYVSQLWNNLIYCSSGAGIFVNSSADFILWLTRALKYHFLYLGLSEENTTQLEKNIPTQKMTALPSTLYLNMNIAVPSVCSILPAATWACWAEVLQSQERETPLELQLGIFCEVTCLAVPLLLFRDFSCHQACWSSQKHTCPAVGGRLAEGNLHLSVSEELCSPRQWAGE